MEKNEYVTLFFICIFSLAIGIYFGNLLNNGTEPCNFDPCPAQKECVPVNVEPCNPVIIKNPPEVEDCLEILADTVEVGEYTKERTRQISGSMVVE